ncbi:hypothetical protein BLNAU_17421 [Blattamonas nauphoetae]|uniref:Ubiquitin-like domain-containing protein n=1 Tax=Blattamonas nauphoetae TaxID=2049346 RepID=A0ABQ9X7I3_9EUKA|nr:hypothetical protein BLNAU_17421 [Blattamonas nauphoetae]
MTCRIRTFDAPDLPLGLFSSHTHISEIISALQNKSDSYSQALSITLRYQGNILQPSQTIATLLPSPNDTSLVLFATAEIPQPTATQSDSSTNVQSPSVFVKPTVSRPAISSTPFNPTTPSNSSFLPFETDQTPQQHSTVFNLLQLRRLGMTPEQAVISLNQPKEVPRQPTAESLPRIPVPDVQEIPDNFSIQQTPIPDQQNDSLPDIAHINDQIEEIKTILANILDKDLDQSPNSENGTSLSEPELTELLDRLNTLNTQLKARFTQDQATTQNEDPALQATITEKATSLKQLKKKIVLLNFGFYMTLFLFVILAVVTAAFVTSTQPKLLVTFMMIVSLTSVIHSAVSQFNRVQKLNTQYAERLQEIVNLKEALERNTAQPGQGEDNAQQQQQDQEAEEERQRQQARLQQENRAQLADLITAIFIHMSAILIITRNLVGLLHENNLLGYSFIIFVLSIAVMDAFALINRYRLRVGKVPHRFPFNPHSNILTRVLTWILSFFLILLPDYDSGLFFKAPPAPPAPPAEQQPVQPNDDAENVADERVHEEEADENAPEVER